jgi:N-methylhydantoinase B
LEAPTRLFFWFDRSRTPGWGLCGGQAGAPPRIEISGTVNRTDLLKANGIGVVAGDTFSVMTGGGGGFGAPT